MFTKILIANRAEIACRVIKTARKLGVSTVAVYSDADRKSRHVRMANEAIYIGGAASSESYLNIKEILRAAKHTNSQAIHPGYGFLSENAPFANECESQNIKFIGPSAKSILEMGLKDKAKDIMEQAGVPVVPGYQGPNQDTAYLKSRAAEIGYPLLIKAVAGGGGKGMRLVEDESNFNEALASCKREAKASFDNDHVLLEKFILKPRHIEVQVFGDSHGGAIHLFERDCSLQRRHQKIVEEAPAPGLPESVRDALGQAAVKAVKALKYENAGTIEFIMNSETYEFFFMEMNTRLQVEHPVTEFITGQDLVEWQLRIAAGQELPLKQDELSINGHSFEARVYAEDPAHEFLPQAGFVAKFIKPNMARVDRGLDEGDDVTIHYDPMIAKIIVHGNDRYSALNNMKKALDEFGIAGIITNQEFLRNIFTHKDFADGLINTGFVSDHLDELIPPSYGKLHQEDIALAAVYFLSGLNMGPKNKDPWDSRDNWRMGAQFTTSLKLMSQDSLLELNVVSDGRLYQLMIDDQTVTAELVDFDGHVLRMYLNGTELKANVFGSGRNLTIFRDARCVTAHLYVHGSEDEDESGEGRIITPMPGKIIDVLVKHGDKVNKDQPLLIMEAMKMEMTIRAGCSGIIDELPVSSNDQVSDGALLVSIISEDVA